MQRLDNYQYNCTFSIDNIGRKIVFSCNDVHVALLRRRPEAGFLLLRVVLHARQW